MLKRSINKTFLFNGFIWNMTFYLFKKILDIRLWEVGAKRPLNGTSKSEQTHRQTHKWTFRLVESIGPEGRCFENHDKLFVFSSFAIFFLFSKLFGFLAAHISYKSLVVSWSVGWKTLCKEWHIKEYKNIRWYTYLTISGSDYWNHIWVKTSLCLHLLLGGDSTNHIFIPIIQLCLCI